MPPITSDDLEIVSRSGWGALAPDDALSLDTPVKYVHINVDGKLPCSNLKECSYRCQRIQKEAMEFFNLDDIPYNFIIGEDGRVYEGRGWQTEPYRNPDLSYMAGISIEIAYVGYYTKKCKPPAACMNTVELLLQYGISAGFIQCNYIKTDYFEQMKFDIEDIILWK